MRVLFLLPYHLSTSGSPYSFAICSEAAYAFFLISLKISTLSFDASLLSNAIILLWRSECHPSAHNQRALFSLAKLYALSINANACLLKGSASSCIAANFWIKSSITASRKYVRVSTASVSFHLS